MSSEGTSTSGVNYGTRYGTTTSSSGSTSGVGLISDSITTATTAATSPLWFPIIRSYYDTPTSPAYESLDDHTDNLSTSSNIDFEQSVIKLREWNSIGLISFEEEKRREKLVCNFYKNIYQSSENEEETFEFILLRCCSLSWWKQSYEYIQEIWQSVWIQQDQQRIIIKGYQEV